MDNNPYNSGYGKEGLLYERQRDATEVLPSSKPLKTERNRASQNTIRAVTPEPLEDQDENGIPVKTAGLIHASPRSIPSGGDKANNRRRGQVFRDSYNAESFDGNRSGPPVSLNFRQRARAWTKDDPGRQRSNSSTLGKSRQRIGSVNSTSSRDDEQPHSANSTTSREESKFYSIRATKSRDDLPSYTVHPSTTSRENVQAQAGNDYPLSTSASLKPSPTLQKSNSVKGGRRLVKKASRPASPSSQVADVPSIDSLPYPVATGDANKILMLMKELCGRMKGEIEHQSMETGPWYPGTCYINDVRGSLMYEGDESGSFHLTLISDLRGCRVRPINSVERRAKCLELSMKASGIKLCLLPLVRSDFDKWLAAFLCWQQIQTALVPPSPSGSSPSLGRPTSSKRDSLYSADGSKPGNIIKVAKLLLWDKGAPSSPTSILGRTSTRDLRAPSRSWRRVSCILQDNGEFKLLTENDVTLLSVIQLSQLSRCSIQRLDRSVLDEDFTIAIYPQYTSTSTQLSIFRPVYIALESRIAYEVWFCLLRAFTIPEIYGPQSAPLDEEDSRNAANDMFRIEKSISVRVVEAKIRKPTIKHEIAPTGKPVKVDVDPSIGDYFVEVILDGELRARTITRPETRNPFWREDCDFKDIPSYLPRLSFILKGLEHPPASAHGFLSSASIHIPTQPMEVVCGTVEIPIAKLDRGRDNEGWHPLVDHQKQPMGEILLRIRHEELVVLLAKDYQPLLDLLCNFSSSLTVQLAQVISTSLRPLAETLMNIFQASGQAVEWLTTLVEDEIDGLGKEQPVRRLRWSRRIGSNESYSSVSDREQQVRDMGKSLQGEANLLFRGNSLLTQALDFHMRRVGKEYLLEVLHEKITAINSLNPDCEVDPSRLPHGQDIHKNWSLLMTLTTEVWDSISDSATRCPPELRKILKYIRAVAEDRFGDFLRTVAYTSVSGFIFLRFFCPALLNPKLFGLLKDHPQPKAQRTLTLVAKTLQALANLSTFGQKEAWMEPMNKFLSGHRQGVKDFLDSVCAISVERNIPNLPASYSTPMTILARLPPTSREGFPSLPYLIDQARSLATLVKLWLETTKQYMEPQGLDGELLDFHEACLELQHRTDECLMKAEESERNADQISLQWEDIVEGLDTTSIRDVANPGLPSPPWVDFPSGINIGSRNAPGSAGSDFSNDRRERHIGWDNNKDNKSKKSKDIMDPTDLIPASPPSRGPSRNGKPTRNFLSGLRRKEKREPSNTPF